MAPRPGLGIDRKTRARLQALQVDYAEAPLNVDCPEYGSANRVFTAAWAEARAGSQWIVVLDSDTVFLGELELPAQADVAVRPVDSKGSSTAGPNDPFEDYWSRLAALQGLPLDRLPFVATTDGAHRVRASYNGGLVAVRRDTGILGAWADLFRRSVAAGYWGSNQAALALTIWLRTDRVHLYPATCNVPLHLLADRRDLLASWPPAPPIHVHYHWMFTDPGYRPALVTLGELGVGRDRLDWLADRLPIF